MFSWLDNYLKRWKEMDDLYTKLFVTFLLLMVCRVGMFLPVPGIDGEYAIRLFQYATKGEQNVFQILDVFSGGAFAQMTIFALGVMPYITASIFVQVGMIFLPHLQREMYENPELGRRKLSKISRVATLFIAFIQAVLFVRYAVQRSRLMPGIIASEFIHADGSWPWLFMVLSVASMVTGTLLLMWIGEQITEFGVGNGTSLIIALGILSSFPSMVGVLLKQMNLDSQEVGPISFTTLLLLCGLFVLVLIGTTMMINGERRISLQYARRTIGQRQVQGKGASYFPLKVNYVGVMPVIFAVSVLSFPGFILELLGWNDGWTSSFASFLVPGRLSYVAIYVVLIFFFSYFWTSMQFRPDRIASDMKRSGAFIAGVKQGGATEAYLGKAMQRILFIGASTLALIALFPMMLGKILMIDPSIAQFFGGTTLLVFVGVVLDTRKQIESHAMMRKYEGMMRSTTRVKV